MEAHMSEKHYIYGSGTFGCLYYDGPHVADTLEGAIDGALCIFQDLPDDVLRNVRSELFRCGIFDFSTEESCTDWDGQLVSARYLAGADYVEVSEHEGPCPDDGEGL
jgi:hypothetical protein